MGRVSTCQKNCNTIDLRRAQVNDFLVQPYVIETYWTTSYFFCYDSLSQLVPQKYARDQ